MKVIKCGTKVCAGGNAGTITAIQIRAESIQYEFSYWLEGKYNTVWVYENEFQLMEKVQKKIIGFKSNHQ